MKSMLSVFFSAFHFRLFFGIFSLQTARFSSVYVALLMALFTTGAPVYAGGGHHHGMAQEHEEEFERGAHNGRLLKEGDFALEMSIFEQGVPPEFRIYPTFEGKPVTAKDVALEVNLVRLGDGTDKINFFAENDYLRGDMEIYEPHSFKVVVSARYEGKAYQWEYDNFEGRTHIHDSMARNLGIKTDIVSAKNFTESLKVYGQLAIPPQAIRHISARFPGEIKTMKVGLGDKVRKGQVLMTVESNESLQTYAVKAPISGVITEQDAGTGEQAGEQTLLTITDMSELIAEISVFPMDAHSVALGNSVSLSLPQGVNNNGVSRPQSLQIMQQNTVQTTLFDVLPQVNAQQALVYRAKVPNKDGKLRAGQFVSAMIDVGEYAVPLAVKTVGLQNFRDFTVVYAKVGEAYEVRMLKLGRQSGEWTEVLGGIKSGTEYVTENSYTIKADIGKSGAAHDH